MPFFIRSTLVFLLLMLPTLAPAQQTQPQPDAAAIDRVLSLLENDASRQQLANDLRALKAAVAQQASTAPAQTGAASPQPAPAAPPAPAGQPAPPNEPAAAAQPAAKDGAGGTGTADGAAPTDAQKEAIITDTGLMGAVAGWVTDIAQRLPNAALGAPIDVRLAQAEQQVVERLTRERTLSDLGDYSARAVPAWILAAALFWIVRRLLRTRLSDRGLVGVRGAALARAFIIRLISTVFPALVAGLAVVLYASVLGLPAGAAQLVILPVSPFLIALTVQKQFCLLLTLLARSRGWRLVVYAQRRLAPWIGIIVAISAFGGVVITPASRIAIGWATAEIISLLLDLAAAVVSLMVVGRHRRTVRSLIVKRGRRKTKAPRSTLHRAITSIGNRWHLLAYAFLTLNIGARLLGTGRGSFIIQAVASILIIVTAVILVSILDRWFEAYAERLRRKWNSGTRDAILVRLAHLARTVAQVMIFIVAAGMCLSLWGFRVWRWTGTATGQAVLHPIFAIAAALITAWIIWISLDAWISTALAATNRRGHARPRSARIKTLLPLLRNFAFVVLTVMTFIAVLANLGVNVAPLLAGAGVVGLAVGFGSQQLVQDVITGLFILLEDSLAIGDVVDTGDRSGTVEALTIRTVKIRDGEGALHSVPFSSIKALKNSSRDFGVYTVTVNLDPAADVDKAVALMKEVGKEVAQDPKYQPQILIPLDVWGVDQVGPDGVVLKGAVRTRPLQQWSVGREINRRLMLRFAENHIPFANRSLLMLREGGSGVRPEQPAEEKPVSSEANA